LIWRCRGFFMMKYTLYSMAIQKFEKEQQNQMEESLFLKDYFAKKLNLSEDVSEEQIMKQLQHQQELTAQKASFLDEIEEKDFD
jgi:hypothetical protein